MQHRVPHLRRALDGEGQRAIVAGNLAPDPAVWLAPFPQSVAGPRVLEH